MQNTQRVDVAFRYSALGDLTLCSAFVNEHAKKKVPLYFVTQKTFQTFAQTRFTKNESLKVIGLETQQKKPLKYFWAGYQIGKEIIHTHAPNELTFYDLHGILKSQIFAWGLWLAFAQTSTKVTFVQTKKHSFLRSLSVFLKKDLLPKWWVYKEHTSLLIERSEATPRLHHSKQKEELILLAPAASQWKKQWTLEHWCELIKRCRQDFPNYKIVIAAPKNHALSTMIFENMNSEHKKSVHLEFNLQVEDLPDLAARASVCVCSNSAWLHIAEAVGTPVVALEGPIVSGLGFSPWNGVQSISLSAKNLHCRPCTKHGGGPCYLKGSDKHACMTRVLPSEVMLSIHNHIQDKGHLC